MPRKVKGNVAAPTVSPLSRVGVQRQLDCSLTDLL